MVHVCTTWRENMGPEKLHVPFLYKMKIKREGTGFPIPSQKVLIYWRFLSRSNASAGPQKPCRDWPQLDTAHKNIGKISLFLSENTRFPPISLQKLDFGKAWHCKDSRFPWRFPWGLPYVYILCIPWCLWSCLDNNIFNLIHFWLFKFYFFVTV